MTGRPWRWIFAFGAAATGLCLLLVAPVGNTSPADAVTMPSSLGAVLAPAHGALIQPRPNFDAGYYQNIVGPMTLTATITVPVVNCSNRATWGTKVEILAVTSSLNESTGTDEHGGGVDVGCSASNASPPGAPVYSGALCDPDASQCGVVPDPVAHGDSVTVAVAASGGCDPTCSSVTVTVTDTTEDWTESWSGTSAQPDFDTYVIAVGYPELAKFAKVDVSRVAVDGAGWSDAQRYALIDQAGHTLAKASKLGNGKTSFSVKWVRSQ
jgi:hypothetical protein